MTTNICVSNGLTNVAEVVLRHILIHSNNDMKNENNKIVFKTQPYCLIVELLNYNEDMPQCFLSMPKNFVPIFPEKSYYSARIQTSTKESNLFFLLVSLAKFLLPS